MVDDARLPRDIRAGSGRAGPGATADASRAHGPVPARSRDRPPALPSRPSGGMGHPWLTGNADAEPDHRMGGLKVGHATDPRPRLRRTSRHLRRTHRRIRGCAGRRAGTRGRTDLPRARRDRWAVHASCSPADRPSGSMPRPASWRRLPSAAIGYEVGSARVPIVPGAVLFDLVNGGNNRTGAGFPP